MIKKILKYTLSFLIFALIMGAGFYAVNRPWGGEEIEYLSPVNRNSAVLIRRSDFPWKRFWLMKEDVRGGVLWYQKIPLPDFGKNTLILGPNTVTVHFMDGKWRHYASHKRSSREKFIARIRRTKTLSTTFDLKSGKPLWSHRPDPRMGYYGLVERSFSSHTIFYDFLYNFISMQPELVAFQIQSGKLLWRKKLDQKKKLYPNLRGNILYLHQMLEDKSFGPKLVTHSFLSEKGKLLHEHVSQYDQSCYGGGAYWYLSARGDLRKIELKPFRDRIILKGINSQKKLFLQACGNYAGRLILLFHRKADTGQYYHIQLTEISPLTGKRFRTKILKSRGVFNQFHIYSPPNAGKFFKNGPYGRYILLRQTIVDNILNTHREFTSFDLKTFRIAYKLNPRDTTFEDWTKIIPGDRSFIIRMLDFPFYAGLWNGRTGRLEKGVYLSSYGIPPSSPAEIKDGVLWLFGGPHWAVLDANSLQPLHFNGPPGKSVDETATLRNVLGFKE